MQRSQCLRVMTLLVASIGMLTAQQPPPGTSTSRASDGRKPSPGRPAFNDLRREALAGWKEIRVFSCEDGSLVARSRRRPSSRATRVICGRQAERFEGSSITASRRKETAG